MPVGPRPSGVEPCVPSCPGCIPCSFCMIWGCSFCIILPMRPPFIAPGRKFWTPCIICCQPPPIPPGAPGVVDIVVGGPPPAPAGSFCCPGASPPRPGIRFGSIICPPPPIPLPIAPLVAPRDPVSAPMSRLLDLLRDGHLQDEEPPRRRRKAEVFEQRRDVVVAVLGAGVDGRDLGCREQLHRRAQEREEHAALAAGRGIDPPAVPMHRREQRTRPHQLAVALDDEDPPFRGITGQALRRERLDRPQPVPFLRGQEPGGEHVGAV